MKKLLRISCLLLMAASFCFAGEDWYYMVYYPTSTVPYITALGANYTNDPASTVTTNDKRFLDFAQVGVSNLVVNGTNFTLYLTNAEANVWIAQNSNGVTYLLSRSNDWDMVANSSNTYVRTQEVRQVQFLNPTNVYRGENLAFGTSTPRSQIHLFGTNDVADEFDRMPNGIIIDGTGLGDQALDYWINGEPRWSDYIYRNEGGEFRYWYNYQSQKDVFVVSRNGRFGINRPSNIMDYHSMFTGTGLNDCYIGGVYTFHFSTVATVTIDGTNAVADTYKIQYSLDNGSTFLTYATGLVIIAGVEVPVAGGLTLMFENQIGHQTNDSWLTVAQSQTPQGTLSVSPPKFEEIAIKTNLSVESYEDITFIGNSTQYGNFYPLRTGTNSAIYLGGTWPWNGIYANVITGAVGAKMVWEYWSGTNWNKLLSGVHYYQDYSYDLSASGKIIWDTGTMPDWSKENLTVGEYTNQYYWVRGRSTNNVTAVPCLSSFSRHAGARLLVYNAHGDNKPAFSVVDDGTVTMGDYRFTEALLQSFYWKFQVSQTESVTATTASVIIPFTNIVSDAYNKYSNTISRWYPGATTLHRLSCSVRAAKKEGGGKGFYVTLVENGNLLAAGTKDIGYCVSGDADEIPEVNLTYVFQPSSSTNYYSLYTRKFGTGGAVTDVVLARGNTNWWFGEKIQ